MCCVSVPPLLFLSLAFPLLDSIGAPAFGCYLLRRRGYVCVAGGGLFCAGGIEGMGLPAAMQLPGMAAFMAQHSTSAAGGAQGSGVAAEQLKAAMGMYVLISRRIS